MAFDASTFIDHESEDGRRLLAGEAPKNPKPFIDHESEEGKYLLAGKEVPADVITAKQQEQQAAEAPQPQQGMLPPTAMAPQQAPGAPTDQLPNQQQFVDPETAPKEEKGFWTSAGETVMDSAKAINLSVGSTARGIMQGLQVPGFNTAPPGMKDIGSSSMGLMDQVQKDDEKDYADAKERSPIASRVAYGGATLAQAYGPGGVYKAGTGILGAVKAMSTGALSGAALAGSQYVHEGESRLQNMLVGGAIGAIIPGAIAAVRGVAKPLIGGFSKGAATKDLMSTIKSTGDDAIGEARETFTAARRLGTQVTPAEAVGGQGLINLEKRIRMTPATQEKAINIVAQREGQLQAVKDKVIKGFVPEGDDVNAAVTKELYSKVEHLQLPPAELSKILSDPVIEDALKLAGKQKGYKLDQFAPGSIGQLDKAHAALRDQIKELTDKGATSLAKGLKESDKVLMNSLDNLSPDYKLARESAQRGIIKNKYLKKIGAAGKDLPGEDTATSSQVYDKLFSSAPLRKQFIEDVVTTGGDPQQAKDLMRVLNRIQKSPLLKLSKDNVAPAVVRKHGDVTARTLDTVVDFMRGRYNNALFENITDPKFLDKVTQLSQIKDTPTMAQELVKVLKGIKPGSVAAIAAPGQLNPE